MKGSCKDERHPPAAIMASRIVVLVSVRPELSRKSSAAGSWSAERKGASARSAAADPAAAAAAAGGGQASKQGADR